MESSYLIVGLGNPGKKYEATRHNIGFMILDSLAGKYKISFKKIESTFSIATFDCEGKLIRLLKPFTFMNLSGIAVATGVLQYNVVLSNLLIICDDINLKFGTLRIRPKGSDGGQKGLRSIISLLGTGQFPRLRVGIGDHFVDAADYVLSPFKSAETKNVPTIINTAADAVESFVSNGIELTMSRFNRNYFEN